MLRATAAYAFVAIYVLVMGPVGMVWTAISGNTTFIYRLARTCLAVAGWISGIRVRIRGLEKIAPGQNYLFLSNHQGNLDGPILFYSINRDLRALIKQEMMRLPILSIVFRQVRFVPIDRSDPARASAGIDRGAEHLRMGLSFFAFPEGTRSRNGRLGEFKKGVFVMAIKAGVPVVPITINNSRKLQPPGSYRIRPGTVELDLHDPIPSQGLSLSERDQLVEMTRAAIASSLVQDFR